jgi:AcrR family transcriptional regulator
MPGTVKKPYHHGDLRDALLAAAEAALAEMPVEDVSLREIARRAGVSHAAPKHHFSSLGALLGEVAAMGFERFVAALDEAANRGSDQSPAARMQAMARAYLRFAMANPAVYGLMFGKREQLEPTPRMVTAMMAAWTQLEAHVAAVVGPQRALHGATLVWSTTHGLATLKLDNRLPPHIDPQAAIESVTRMLIAGLQSDT